MNSHKIRIPIVSKLLGITVSITFIFGLLMIVTVFWIVRSSLLNQQKTLIDSLLVQQTQSIKQTLDVASTAVDKTATMSEVVNFLESDDPKTQDITILSTLTTFSIDRGYSSIYLLDKNGKCLVSTDPSFVNNDFSFRKYFQSAIKGDSFSEIAIGSVSKKLGFYYSSPIIGSTGNIIGVMAVKVDPEPIFEILRTSKLKINGNIMVVNSDGVIIFSLKENQIYKSLTDLPESTKREIIEEKRYPNQEITPLDYPSLMTYIKEQKNSENLFSIYDEDDLSEELVGIKKIGIHPFYLVFESDLSNINGIINQISSIVIFIIFISLAFGATATSLLFKRILSPLKKLTTFAESISAGKSADMTEINSGDELESLSRNLKDMVYILEKSNKDLQTKVNEKTEDLSKKLEQLETNKKAIINVLEDSVELEKDLKVEKENVEKKVEERTRELNEQKTKLTASVSSLPIGFIMIDNDHNIIFSNKRSEAILGVTNNKLTNFDDVLKLFPKDSVIHKLHEDYHHHNQKNIEKSELDFGSKILTVSLIPITADTSSDSAEVLGSILILDDITEIKNLDRSKDEFFSIASHELRTPLTAIRGNTSMIMEYYANVLKDPELKSMIDDIHQSSIRLISIVNDFLNLSRLEQNKLVFNIKDFDLDQLIKDTLKEYSTAESNNHLSFEYLEPKTSLPRVSGDSNRVREVLINLLGNAVKFTTKGKIKVSTEISGKYLKVLVTDTGRGISIKQQNLLFHKFQQAGSSLFTRDTSGGSGLGLYISKLMMEGMGGKISLESSEENVGSTFSFQLPLAS